MFKKTMVTIAFALSASGTASAAIPCLAPHPACAIVGVGLVAQIIAAKLNEDKNPRALGFDGAEEKLAAIAADVLARENGRYIIRMSDYDNYNPGYGSVIRRYESGKISGNLSLESLLVHRPRLIADLDTLSEIIGAHYSAEEVSAYYGDKHTDDGQINWYRYYLLATDAKAIYHNTWVYR